MLTPLQSLYAQRAATPSDINQHLPLLRDLARGCTTIVEFGTRTGNSTTAFLAGLESTPGAVLHSYDLAPQQFTPPDLGPDLTWHFHQADTTTLPSIPRCDLLFIDTLHNCATVAAELVHAPSVARHIVFHDTVLFGSRDEQGSGPGINHAIFAFLAASPEWTVADHYAHNCGLLLLARRA